MLPTNHDNPRHKPKQPKRSPSGSGRLKVVLFGGFIVIDASGTVAIGTSVVFLVLMGAGRWLNLW